MSVPLVTFLTFVAICLSLTQGKSLRHLGATVSGGYGNGVDVYVEGPRGGSTSTNIHTPDRDYVQIYYDVEMEDIDTEDMETEYKSINVNVNVPNPNSYIPDVPDIPKASDYIPNYMAEVHIHDGDNDVNVNYDGELLEGGEAPDFVTEKSDDMAYDIYIHGHEDVPINIHLPIEYEARDDVTIIKDMDLLEPNPEDLETEDKSVNVHVSTPSVPNVNVNVPGAPNVNVHYH